MSPEEFGQYVAQGYNRIPLCREVLADLDTPLSTYLKLASGPYSYLLESVQGGEKWGRYSIIGLPARTVVRVIGNKVSLETDGEVVEEGEYADPLSWIAEFHARFNVLELPDLPRTNGGLVGYFGYDTVAYIEPKVAGQQKPDALQTPDILLMLSDEVVVFDNLSGKLSIILHVEATEQAYQAGLAKLDQLEDQLRAPTAYPEVRVPRNIKEQDFVSGFTQDGYKDAVSKARQYITDGEIMQVVLSQRLSIPFSAKPLDLYRALRCLNPSPYMYYLDCDDFHIVGSSPEILVRLEDEVVTVRPIAGTRPRGQNPTHDLALEKELLADPKEIAEHVMLIDLGRNDIGRVCKVGTVKLTEEMVIERYSHVMHIVSNVEGSLNEGLDAMDVLRATFPAGTVSGAPKVRAMQIIEALEPIKRGVYAGAVGYWSWSGAMDTAIAIRTAVIKDKELSIQVGAGIVYDSDPQKEWEETMNKGRAIFKAVALAEAGLNGGQ